MAIKSETTSPARLSPIPPKAATKRATAQPKTTASATKALVRKGVTAQTPQWTETLQDGTHVLIRPMRKTDIELERRFIKRLSPQTQRLRFLGLIKEPSNALLRQLTDIDYVHDVAFVALVHRDGEKQEIGVSRYNVGSDGKTCECAVVVGDDWRNKGLGTLLMRHLISVARDNGMRTLVSYDAADNVAMRDLASHLGFKRVRDEQDGRQVIHRLDL